MSPRLISVFVALVFLSGCGPEQAKINGNNGNKGEPHGKIAPKQWDKSKPKVAELLEKRQQLIARSPVPWSPGLSLEQAAKLLKSRIASARDNAQRQEVQEKLEILEQAKKTLEEDPLRSALNTVMRLESYDLRMERAGIDPSCDGVKEDDNKFYFKNEKIKKDYLMRSKTNIKNMKEFKDQLEEIEHQLEAASK